VSKDLPLRGRCPVGAEGENLAIARNISDCRTVLSPTACGRSPLAEGAKGETHLFRHAELPPRGKPFGSAKNAHAENFRVCVIFVLLYFSHRPAEQVGGGAVMGNEDRGALPRQPFCGGDGVLDKLGVHAGKGLVQ